MSEVVASGSGYTGERESRKRKHNNGDGGDSDDETNKKGHDKHGEVGVQQKVQRMATDSIQPAALLVIDRWGSPIHGGIAAALYLIVGLLKNLGFLIYCTVLEADKKSVHEATRIGVNLIFPERKREYEKLRPNYLWLVAHNTFFPHLTKIENLKFVFGFGLVSASIALNIKENVLSGAKYFHVNVWCPDELPDNMFTYDKEFTESNYEWLDHQNLHADAVLSIGQKTFEFFDDRFGSRLTEHIMLFPLPEIRHFEVRTANNIPRTRNFQILTPIENCYASYMAHNDILPYSMNLVSESYDNFGKEEPPKWKIMCMDKFDDKTISERLKPHPKLRILSDGFTKEKMSSEIDFSHLIILPPLSINSLNVTLTTIARGKPIIVPLASESDYFIEKHFSEFRHNMVVDMRSKSDELKEKVVDVIKNYATYLKYASRVRDIMKNKVMNEVQTMNSKLFDYIQQYVQLPEESTSGLLRKDTDTTTASTIPSTSMQAIAADQSSSEQSRKPGSLTVQIETSYGSAVEGSSMADVNERFHKIEGSRPATEGTGKVLRDTHKDIDVEKVEEGCLRYVTNCGSLEALEALWSEYISGQLDKTIHSTIITPTLLSKIQAHYLTLDIYIPVQEYLLCKREIPLLTGSDTRPYRRRSVAAITELKSRQPRNVDRNHTVDYLNLVLSQIQIRDGQNHSGLLCRDDLQIPELHHHRMTFVTKRDKVRLDVHVREGKLRESFRKKDKVDSTLNAEVTSVSESMNETISDFLHLKIHSSKHSIQQKAVLHEAGQKLLTQREHVTDQATPLKEKSEARNVVINWLQGDLERVHQAYPVKGSVLEVFGSGSMPGQFNWARGIYIKNNGQWVICDYWNNRVQVIDPIKLCCDLILQFHAFPESFNPWNVTVDEDNDQYFMSDRGNGQVVVSSGQSKILNCFGCKEGISPTGICLSPDGFIFIGDLKGYVRKYNKSGEHIARTEKGQVSNPWDLIVNKKCIFVSDTGIGRKCVHVLNHQMQSIRDIGEGHLQWPYGLCFDHQQDGIYVCDRSGHRVVHFNCDGEFLSYKGQGQLEYPLYIALCKDNPYRLVVTQYDGCVKLLYI